MTPTSARHDITVPISRTESSGSVPVADQHTTIGRRYQLDGIVDEDELRVRHRANDLWVGRAVLLDVFSSATDLDANQEGRLLRRLARIAQVRARGFPRMLDGGLDEQAGPFIVTEPVPAPSLRSVIRGPDRLTGARARAYAIEAARTLQAAHSRGVVHGRLCPENVHVDPVSERTWMLGWVDGAMPRTRTRGLLAGGGSASPYLAPEIFRDELIGPAADVFSLGVVLYEMLTGQRPTPTSRRARHPSISKRLQPVIERALDPDPRRRWQSAEAFATAIEEAMPAASAGPSEPLPLAERTIPTAPRSPRRTAGATASVLAVAGTLLTFVVIALYFIRSIGDMPLIVNGVALSVPSVLGKTVEEAQQIARDNNMELIVVGEREGDRYPVGQIMQQSPVAGWRPYDKQPIRVTVSAGVWVPDLTGKSFADAAKQANQLGWKIARVESARSEGQQSSAVLMQSPAPGDVVHGPGELALVIAE